MDRTEGLVLDHLRARGFSDVVHEPDGNVPPDFLVDGRIAVEARRLNQNIETGGRIEGLEQHDFPLRDRMRALLASLGPADESGSWFVLHDFRRPIPSWLELRRSVVDVCNAVARLADCPAGTTLESELHPNFTLQFFKSSKTFESRFVPGGSSDFDSGGFVVGEVARNLRYCIDEKTKKIARVRHRYPEWWLILVDQIGYGLDPDDQEQLKAHGGVEHAWDKVILVSPSSPERFFEL